MGFRDVCPRPARSWCEGSSIRVPSPLVTTRHGRAARVGAAATAAATRGAGVAGEPLRRVDAPTPLLLRSPPLAKVQSHSHHLPPASPFAVSRRPSTPGRARRHSRIASQPAELRRVRPLPSYPAPQRRKSRTRSHTRKQAQTAAVIWQAARRGRGSAVVRARGSRWCQKGQRPMRSACSCPPPWERGVGVHLPWVRSGSSGDDLQEIRHSSLILEK